MGESKSTEDALFDMLQEAPDFQPGESPSAPSADSSEDSDSQYLCTIGGVQTGPLSTKQLQALIDEGKLGVTDRLRKSDSLCWIPCRELSELAFPGSSNEPGSKLGKDIPRGTATESARTESAGGNSAGDTGLEPSASLEQQLLAEMLLSDTQKSTPPDTLSPDQELLAEMLAPPPSKQKSNPSPETLSSEQNLLEELFTPSTARILPHSVSGNRPQFRGRSLRRRAGSPRMCWLSGAARSHPFPVPAAEPPGTSISPRENTGPRKAASAQSQPPPSAKCSG